MQITKLIPKLIKIALKNPIKYRFRLIVYIKIVTVPAQGTIPAPKMGV